MQTSTGVIFGSMVSAFIIGAGGGLSIGLAAGNGKLNTLSVALIVATGAVAAAKDYRTLMRLPPVKERSFDSDPEFLRKNLANMIIDEPTTYKLPESPKVPKTKDKKQKDKDREIDTGI